MKNQYFSIGGLHFSGAKLKGWFGRVSGNRGGEVKLCPKFELYCNMLSFFIMPCVWPFGKKSTC